MAYNEEIRELAFARYCTATSFEQVAEIMAEEFPEQCGNLGRNTVRGWAKKYNWEQRKLDIERKVAAQNDQAIVSDRKQMLGEMKALRERIYHKLEKAQLKSLEGGVNAYGNLCKWIVQLSGSDSGRRIDIDDAIMLIFEVLGRHPKIGQLIQKHEEFLLGQLHAEINKRASDG